MPERSYKSLFLCWGPTVMSGFCLLDLEWMHGETATAFADSKLQSSRGEGVELLNPQTQQCYTGMKWGSTQKLHMSRKQFRPLLYTILSFPWCFQSLVLKWFFSSYSDLCSNLTPVFLCSVCFAVWPLYLCFVLLDRSMWISKNRLGLNICIFLVFWNGAFLALSVSCPELYSPVPQKLDFSRADNRP